MQSLTYDEIVKAVSGTLIQRGKEVSASGVTTDSRKVAVGNLFIPIKGVNFDGHDFIQASFDSGASGTLTHRDIDCVEGKWVIKVSDTQRALGDLAKYCRSKFQVPLIAITGSVGKTSTKDMVHCVLSTKYNVLKTEGNFNNEIGLPLSILKLDETHQAAVIEMGMSGFGEISRLTAIAKPDVAIITNIGMSHIEKLGSRQNILKAKLEILEGLKTNGLVILNGDDNLLAGMKGLINFRSVFYGMGEGVDYQAYDIKSVGEKGTYFMISVGPAEYYVHVPVPGIHNVYNALAAFAAGIELGIPADSIIEGIAQFSSADKRLNIIKCKGFKIIDDTYNASPNSMEAGLNVLSQIKENGMIIAVLGDMLEMGEWSARAHYDVGRYAAGIKLDYLITVGREAANIAAGAAESGMPDDRIFSFDGNAEAADFLISILQEGDTVLVKGSRGMKMDDIVETLKRGRDT